MYEPFFGFSQRPFAAAPTAKRFFPASSIDAARQTLSRAIDRAEGIGLVIGPPGIGKTVLLHVLAEQFRERFATVVFSAGQLETRRELLQAISFDLGLAYQNKDEGELRLGLVDYLARSDKCPQGMLVLVDEAHVLPPNVLEELRMMTNLAKDGEPRVRLLLAGTMRLEEQLTQPRLESFSQRLTARCYLDSFDQAESADYVRFQVAVAGGRLDAVFLPEAVTAVYRATDGVPRLINQICDQALHLAFTQGRRPVDARLIAAAWAELQQLPAPWHDTPPGENAEPTRNVIEFGELTDEPEEAAGEYPVAAAGELTVAASFNGDDTVELSPNVLGELLAGEQEANVPFALEPPTIVDRELVRAGVRPLLADATSGAQLLAETAAAFDEIERQVTSLESDVDPLPTAAERTTAAPAVVPIAPPATVAADPFERFEDEELLLDRYAALDSRAKPPAILPLLRVEGAPADAFSGDAYEEDCDELCGAHLELSDHAEFFEVVVDPYWDLGADEDAADEEGGGEVGGEFDDSLERDAADDDNNQVVAPVFPRAASEPVTAPRQTTISLSDAIRRRAQPDAAERTPAPAASHIEPLLKLRREDTTTPPPAAAAPPSPLAVQFGQHAELVVVDELPDEGSIFDTGRLLERQDYRQLFAKLKRS